MFLGGRSQTPLNHSGDFFCPKLCRKEGSKYSMASALEGDCIPGDSKAPGNMPVHSGGGEPYGKCLESWSLLPRVVALICECLRLSELPGAPGCAASWHHCQRHSLVPSESLPWLFQLSACLAACRVSLFLCCVSLSSGIDCFFQCDLLFLIQHQDGLGLLKCLEWQKQSPSRPWWPFLIRSADS